LLGEAGILIEETPFVLAYVIVDGCKTAIAKHLKAIKQILSKWNPSYGPPYSISSLN
jgi:hypothetical protein